MNYSEALSFTFQDEVWMKKMAIGGLFGMLSMFAGLPFIFGFFLIGYYVGVLRNVMNGQENPLPDWSDISKIFVDGLLGTIISMIYFLIIGGICAALIVRIATDPYMLDAERVILIVMVSFATLFALGIFINFGLMQLAATDNFGAAFSLSGLLGLLKKNLGTFIAVLAFSLILNGILFLAGLVILSPFTNFWGMVVQAHLFGQCANGLRAASPAVQSA